MISGAETIPAHGRIGIDIGRVITAAVTDGEPSIFSEENFLLAPEMPGAVEAIHDVIVPQFGPDNTYLVSKCGPAIQHRTTRWLQHIDFYERTGMRRGNVLFCLERSEKALIAARLGLTHFIDDREDVFNGMPDSVEHKLHFAPGSFEGDERLAARRGALLAVNGWLGIRTIMHPTSTAA